MDYVSVKPEVGVWLYSENISFLHRVLYLLLEIGSQEVYYGMMIRLGG